jgi:hypothetical protein
LKVYFRIRIGELPRAPDDLGIDILQFHNDALRVRIADFNGGPGVNDLDGFRAVRTRLEMIGIGLFANGAVLSHAVLLRR